MQLSIKQAILKDALGQVGRCVASKSTLPVLSNVLLRAEDNTLTLAATNLECGLVVKVGVGLVKEPGDITVPAKLLSDLVNSLPKNELITLEDTGRTATLKVSCAGSRSSVKGIPSSEFPDQPRPDVGNAIALDPAALREAIAQVIFCAASDDSRAVLTGVLVEVKGSEGHCSSALSLAASNGFRLGVAELPLPKDTPPASAIVPVKSLAEVARLCANVESVQMVLTDSQAFFITENAVLSSQLVEGKFPDYRRLVPTSHSTSLLADVAALREAVRVASLFARDSANIVRLGIWPAENGTPARVWVEATSDKTGNSVA